MRVTIGPLDGVEDTLWEDEAITAIWDSERDEFVIRGDGDTRAPASQAKNPRLAVQIEETGAGRLMWRGYVNAADLLWFETEQVECCLTMFMEGWVGIVPLFSTS